MKLNLILSISLLIISLKCFDSSFFTSTSHMHIVVQNSFKLIEELESYITENYDEDESINRFENIVKIFLNNLKNFLA